MARDRMDWCAVGSHCGCAVVFVKGVTGGMEVTLHSSRITDRATPGGKGIALAQAAELAAEAS